MNRRSFLGATISSIAVAQTTFAQTPVASPEPGAVDLRAREIVAMLEHVSPVALLEALETSPVSGPSEALAAIPWQDFGDTDLYNSLGGVIISHQGADLNNGETEIYGGYIVYESAEIAYHELIHKLGDAHDAPSMTTTMGGTNHWVLESNDVQISVGRIGCVILLGLFNAEQNETIDLVGHLHMVAASLH